ncbi:20417_t:CDS:2, partial [Gigaspora rosea]
RGQNLQNKEAENSIAENQAQKHIVLLQEEENPKNCRIIEINLFLEEQKNIFKATLRVNSSQLQNTEEDTSAHNSSTLKMNRICKGKDKEVIAKSSKKVPSKEDWSVEKDLMYKKSGSSLVDQIKTGKHLEFKLACHNINGLKRNIQ